MRNPAARYSLLRRLLLMGGAALLAVSCNSTRYVPRGSYLLQKNKIEVESERKKRRRDRITPNDLMPYVQQRPNDKLLGINLYLGFYNLTDTAKQSGWHRFWRNKIGEAPVIWDSVRTEESVRQMKLYLEARGYLDAEVTDSVIYHRRKPKVKVLYRVKEHEPYTISSVSYRIEDDFLEPLILEDTASSLIRSGVIFSRDRLDAERERISERLLDMGFWGFNKGYITYPDNVIDREEHTVALNMRLRKRIAYRTDMGVPVLENHPIYRISDITVNTEYDPTKSSAELAALPWDTLYHHGIEVLYTGKRSKLRPNVLVGAVRLSPNELYNRTEVQRTYNNIRNLQYSPNILFNELPYDTLTPIEVTSTGQGGSHISTTERNLFALIQATPNVRHSFSADVELSTTADYYSAALTLGYQNRNLFRGAENLSVNFRGAYELMKNQGKKNSHELGVNVALDIPRFLLPVHSDRLARFQQQRTNMSLSISTQRRPYYDRTLFSGTFGYSWSMRNGARFQITPADINIVSVPRVDENFLSTVENPYLRNSYQSQLIAGLSAGYYYQTTPNYRSDGFVIRLTGDVNGNLIGGLAHLFGRSTTINEGTPEQESYHKILGIRYAQYGRVSFDLSTRVNLSPTTQLAWRFFAGGGRAYGNSKTLPFERLYFAGGSNSMRGWQVRTLGPGSTYYVKENYPNQLGDFRLETNLEYRFAVVRDFGMALFFDAGNIWLNAKGSSSDARFRFNRFYKQIAFNTGLGARYDFGFVLLRLDWGVKLHNPNVPQGERWKSGFKFNQTVLNFAIGLPF